MHNNQTAPIAFPGIGKLNILLPFSVRDLEGNELLAAGTILNQVAIEDVAARGRNVGYKTGDLLQHGTIRQDLESFMGEAPFVFIFGDCEGIQVHLERIGEVPIPRPMLSALDKIKEYDFCTYRHSLTVFALTTFMMNIVCPEMTVGRNELLGGPSHDIGKLCISKDILNKKTPLTSQERQLLNFHTVAGFVLLSYYLGDHLHPATHIALNHHERSNGSGYPRGVSEIDPLLEMVAICDIYDALVSPRPYRNVCFDNRAALEELSVMTASGAFDVLGVKALIGRNRAGHPDPDQVKISTEKRGTAPSQNCYAQLADN